MAKLRDPKVFAVLIDAYGLVPESLIMPAAVLLSVMEVMVALGLFIDIRGSLTLTAGLMILFMAILGYGIFMGLDIDCGCFGPDDPEAKAFHGLRVALCRDAVIMAGIAFLYIWRFRQSVEPIRLKEGFKIFLKMKGGLKDATH